MRLRIVATAGYHYDAPTSASCIEARLFAASTDRQRVQSTSLECDPSGWKLSFVDYWGTPTVAVHLREPHDTLALVGTSVVDVEASGPLAPKLSWDDLASDAVFDAFAEYQVTDADGVGADLAVAVAEVRRYAATPLAFARALPDVTDPDADLLLEELRRAGVPARLVRGLRVDATTLGVGDSVDVEPRVWVEVWDGAWTSVDPTDGGPCDGHVAFAFGRRRSDLAALRGVYSGEGHSEGYQRVTVRRLG